MSLRAMALAFSFILVSPLALPNFNSASGKGKGSSNSGSQTKTRVEADLDPVNNFVAEGSSKYENRGTKEQFEGTVEIPFSVFNSDLATAEAANVQIVVSGSVAATCSLEFDEIEDDFDLGTVAEYKVVIQANGGAPFPKKGDCEGILPAVIAGDTATASVNGQQILTGTYQNH